MTGEYFYRHCLRSELDRRVAKNRGYSLRAFAKALKLEPGALSQFLSGKRVPSYKAAVKVLRALDLSPDDRAEFLASLARHHQSRGLKRLNPVFREAGLELPPREVPADLFRVIGDWYHYGLLLLSEVEGFKEDPRWIASRLGISVLEAKLALERLVSVQLLQKTRGRLRFVDGAITTANKEVTTPGLKRRQRQILEKAVESLENDPIEESSRSMTGMTMAIDPARLPEAKKLISKMNREMSKLLETGKRTEVYELQISLFPLSQGRRK